MDKLLSQGLNVLVNHGQKIAQHTINGDKRGVLQEVGLALVDEVLPEGATKKIASQVVTPFISGCLYKEKQEFLPTLINQAMASSKTTSAVGNVASNIVKDAVSSKLLGVASTALALTPAGPIVGFTSLIAKGLAVALPAIKNIKETRAAVGRIEAGVGRLEAGQTGIADGISRLEMGQAQIAQSIDTGQTRIADGISRLEMGQAQIAQSIDSGFNAVNELVNYNGKLLDRVLDQQKTHFVDLKGEHARTRHEMHTRFNETQEKTQKAIDAAAIRNLRATSNQLLGNYQAFKTLLQKGQTPCDRDLHNIEKVADNLMAQFEAYYEELPLGSPARLPFINGIAFALGAWCDARQALGDPLDYCYQRARQIAELVKKELRAINDKSSLYALAVQKAPLITQYVTLLQSLRAVSSIERHKGKEGVVLLATPVWDDGLQKLRDLFTSSLQKSEKCATSAPDLHLVNATQRLAWCKLAKLPPGVSVTKVSSKEFHRVLGIPDEVFLDPQCQELLISIAPPLLEQNSKAMKQLLSG